MSVLSPGKEVPARARERYEKVTPCSRSAGIHLTAIDHSLAATGHLESIYGILREAIKYRGVREVN